MTTDRTLDAPFVSSRGRTMALSMAALAVLIFGGVGAFTTMWSPGNRILMLLLGVVMGLALLRWASVRAEARAEGLWVRNLFLSRTVSWDEILGVRFPDGDAFAHVDLADGDTLSIMAIQRADGPRAQTEAQRLADLVAAHSSAS